MLKGALGMIPTFSINQNPYDHMDKVIQLLNAPKTQTNQEWLSEAYIKIIEGKGKDVINLSAFSQICETNSMLKRAKKPDTPLIFQDELTRGYKGVTDLVADCVDGSIDDILETMDEEYYVKNFINVRERIYFAVGRDIWRLIELAKLDDLKAQSKLREVIKEFDLKEIIEYVLTKPSCYKRLGDILC